MVQPTFASDSLETMADDAFRLAGRGKVNESTAKMDSAVSLALSTKSQFYVVEKLRTRKISLLFDNHLYQQALAAVSDGLSRKDQILKSLSRDPELGVDVDEIFDKLMIYGESADSIESFKLALEWSSTFPQFDDKRRERTRTAIYVCQAKHGLWADAESYASRAFKQSRGKDDVALARMQIACAKQNKTKDAARLAEQLSSKTPHERHSPGHDLFMAGVMLNVPDMNAAESYANKESTVIGSKDTIANRYAISESFNMKATAELALGKLSQAEADARIALAGSVGEAQGENAGNLALLEKILRKENKKAEADKIWAQKFKKRYGPSWVDP